MTSDLLHRLPPATYTALCARYRPIEACTKRWVIALPDPASRVLRMQAYHAFLEAARHSWPIWPPASTLPPLLTCMADLAEFEATIIATILWVEWADQELRLGIHALAWLCADLRVARGHAAPLGRRHREPLWRPEVSSSR